MADAGDVQADTLELVNTEGQVAKEVKLLPYGNPFFGRDGRGPWILRDQTHAESVIALTRVTLGNIDMMVDYDHASELAAPEGKGRAIAAGWIKNLRAEADGIWGTIEWTPQARAELASRQYRYINPYFRVNKTTREVTRLVNAGLTNSPNLELPALAAFDRRAATRLLTEEERAICSQLGVDEMDFLRHKSPAELPASPALADAMSDEEKSIVARLGLSEASYMQTRASRAQ